MTPPQLMVTVVMTVSATIDTALQVHHIPNFLSQLSPQSDGPKVRVKVVTDHRHQDSFKELERHRVKGVNFLHR